MMGMGLIYRPAWWKKNLPKFGHKCNMRWSITILTRKMKAKMKRYCAKIIKKLPRAGCVWVCFWPILPKKRTYRLMMKKCGAI